jgi:hypothetical protein
MESVANDLAVTRNVYMGRFARDVSYLTLKSITGEVVVVPRLEHLTKALPLGEEALKVHSKEFVRVFS